MCQYDALPLMTLDWMRSMTISYIVDAADYIFITEYGSDINIVYIIQQVVFGNDCIKVVKPS